MRRNFYAIAALSLVVLIFTGCGQQEELRPNTVELMRFNLNTERIETLHVDLEKSDIPVKTRNPNSIVTANYLTVGDHRIVMKATENPSGVHGNGTIDGPIYIDIRFNSACVNEIGNRATVGGEITFVELGDNPFEFPIEPGWYLYVAVEDNGNGKKGPKDRYHGEVFFSPPEGGPLCFIISPEFFDAWPLDTWYDVQGKNDKIIVK